MEPGIQGDFARSSLAPPELPVTPRGAHALSESTFTHRRALADAAPDQLSVFQGFASQYSPPDAPYAVVNSADEYLSILNAGEGFSRRFARVSDEIQYLEIAGAFMVPTNANATVDCQQAVLSFEPPTPTAANGGSGLEMFSCSILGFPEEGAWAAEVTLSDVALVYPCQV